LRQLDGVKPWPLDRPARVTLELDDGSSLSAYCEAALGSPARPLEADRVLRKIGELGARDAPGLAPAVIALREAIDAGRLTPPTAGEWIASFFARRP
jgi:2-methylcitrate dehydratase PrpD